MMDGEPLDEEYSSVEVAELVAEALSDSPTMPVSWLETRLYEGLYNKLSKYMDRNDLLVALTDLRTDFFEGFTHTTPESLHKVCKRCRLCEGVKHPASTPSWNVVDPDLMIVVENPTVALAYSDFLTTALKSVGFAGDRCMLTYLTRCPAPNNEIEDQWIANCTPYLHSEMQACSPKLTLSLGAKCWGAITGDYHHRISDVEGDITWFGLYPMLPGMSLAWYAYGANKSSNRGNGKFIDLLTVAHNFVYTQQKKESVPNTMKENEPTTI